MRSSSSRPTGLSANAVTIAVRKAEAAAQAARDVVLPAPLGHRERARGRDPAVAGVEAEHHLAEGDEVEPALLARAEVHAVTSAPGVAGTPFDLVETAVDESAPARRSRSRRRRATDGKAR